MLGRIVIQLRRCVQSPTSCGAWNVRHAIDLELRGPSILRAIYFSHPAPSAS